MPKICKSCGAMNGNQATICSRCHKPLQNTGAPQQRQTPPMQGYTTRQTPPTQGYTTRQTPPTQEYTTRQTPPPEKSTAWQTPPTTPVPPIPPVQNRPPQYEQYEEKSNNTAKKGIGFVIAAVVLVVVIVGIKMFLVKPESTDESGTVADYDMESETQYGSREEAKSLADDFMAEKGFQNYQFSETTLESATYVVTYSINEEHTMVKLSGNISVYVEFYLTDEKKVSSHVGLYHLDQTKLDWNNEEISGNWYVDTEQSDEYFNVNCAASEGEVTLEYNGNRRGDDETWSGAEKLPENLQEATHIEDDLKWGYVNSVKFNMNTSPLINVELSEWTQFYILTDGAAIQQENNIQNLANSNMLMMEKQ